MSDDVTVRSDKTRVELRLCFRLKAPLLVSESAVYLFLLGDLLLWFGDDLLLLSQDHLDVAGGAHVGVDAAVSTVRAPPHLGGLVDLDVLDDQRVHIQTLKPHGSRKWVRDTWTCSSDLTPIKPAARAIRPKNCHNISG